jgi:octanoyl-[GcvH]:protein N-octanoyltransferase
MMLYAAAGFPELEGLDTAVSHALLLLVARREHDPVLRIHRAGSFVAFGKRDVVDPGFLDAVDAARASGFAPIERLAGGRAAVFHPGTLAFSLAVPTDDPRSGITSRFEEISRIMADAFRSLGADARIGAVPGEYCPGAHSVNTDGTRKVMGVGQRIISGAAHVGGVVVVHGGDLIAEVLRPVYDALHVPWDPSTSGDLASSVPGVTVSEVQAAILDQFEKSQPLTPTALDGATLDLAASLRPLHVPGL